MNKLVVEEFTVVADDGTQPRWKVGEKYSLFKDPKTGKYYRPKKDFVVKGDNLESLFVEIKV